MEALDLDRLLRERVVVDVSRVLDDSEMQS